MPITINNEFNFGQIVYLKTDKDQRPFQIIEIKTDRYRRIMYFMAAGTFSDWFTEIEISADKDTVLSTTN